MAAFDVIRGLTRVATMLGFIDGVKNAIGAQPAIPEEIPN